MTFAKISYQLSLLQCDAAEPDAEIHDNQVIIFHILHLESPCKLVAPYVTKFGLYHGFKHHVFKDVSGSCIMDIYICVMHTRMYQDHGYVDISAHPGGQKIHTSYSYRQSRIRMCIIAIVEKAIALKR